MEVGEAAVGAVGEEKGPPAGPGRRLMADAGGWHDVLKGVWFAASMPQRAVVGVMLDPEKVVRAFACRCTMPWLVVCLHSGSRAHAQDHRMLVVLVGGFTHSCGVVKPCPCCALWLAPLCRCSCHVLQLAREWAAHYWLMAHSPDYLCGVAHAGAWS